MLRAIFDASLAVLRNRRVVLLPGAALAIALPLAGVTMSRSAHGVASANRAQGIGAPAVAGSPEASPTATPPVSGPGQPGVPVHLPLLNLSNTYPGPVPTPRPGSRILVPSVGLQVGVVDYSDCSGETPMTRLTAVHFMCTPAAVTTFVGHNPGVFTPLLRTQAGDHFYYQHDGVQDAWVLTGRYRVSPQDAAAYSQDGSYQHAVLATCAEPDSSAYWIFVGAPVGAPGGLSASGQAAAPPPSQPGPGHPQPKPSPSPSPTPGSGLPGGVTLPPPPPPPI